MYDIEEEVLSAGEIAEMESMDVVPLSNHILERVKRQSARLLIAPSSEAQSILAAGKITTAKASYVRRRLVSAEGATQAQSSDVLEDLISRLDAALQTYIMAVVDWFAAKLPHVLGHQADEFIKAVRDGDEFSMFHAVTGLLVAAREMRTYAKNDFARFIRCQRAFFDTILLAHQIFAVMRLGKEAWGMDVNVTPTMESLSRLGYISSGAQYAVQISREMGVAVKGAPEVTVIDDEVPATVYIEFLLSEPPGIVCEANNRLSRLIAQGGKPIPSDLHLCFGVA